MGIEEEYKKALDVMYKACPLTDPDVIKITEWAKETFKKYGWTYKWPL